MMFEAFRRRTPTPSTEPVKIEMAEGTVVTPRKTELAYGVDRWRRSFGGLVFNPDVLKKDRGHLIYTHMIDTDEIVKASAYFKMFATLSPGFEIMQDSDQGQDQMAKDLCVYAIEHMAGTLSGAIFHVLDAIIQGFSVQEINPVLYTSGPFAGKFGIGSLKLKPCDTFNFDIDDFGNLKPKGLLQRQKDLHQAMSKEQMTPLPVDKFLIFSYLGTPSNPYGKSDLLTAYRSWFAKDLITKFWSIFLEKFAAPTPLAKWKSEDGDPPVEDRDEMLTALQNLHAAQAGVFSDVWDVKLLESIRSGSVSYKEAIEHHNLMISRSILLPSLITDTQTRGAHVTATTHFKSFVWVLQFLQQQIEDAMNEQVFRRFVDWNIPGVVQYPWFKFKPFTSETIEALTRAFGIAIKTGFAKPTEPFIREALGWPEWPDDIPDFPDPTKTTRPDRPNLQPDGETPEGTKPDDIPVDEQKKTTVVQGFRGSDTKAFVKEVNIGPAQGYGDPPGEEPPNLPPGTGSPSYPSEHGIVIGQTGFERLDLRTIDRNTIQAILFDRVSYPGRQDVNEWLRKNMFPLTDMGGSERRWIVRLRDPGSFIDGSLEPGEIDFGVVVIRGNRRVFSTKTFQEIVDTNLRDITDPTPQERRANFKGMAGELDRLEGEYVNRLGGVMVTVRDEFMATIRSMGFLNKRTSVGLQKLTMPRQQRLRSTMSEMLAEATLLGVERAKRETELAAGDKLKLKKTLQFTTEQVDFASVPGNHTDVVARYVRRIPVPDRLLTAMDRRSFTITGVTSDRLTGEAKILLDQGIVRGTPPRVVEGQLVDLFEGYIPETVEPGVVQAGRLQTIIRTNMMSAFNTGRLAFFKEPVVWAVIRAFQYSAVMDDRTTDICIHWHGKVVKKDDPLFASLQPPNHFQCRSLWLPVHIREAIRVTPSNVLTRLPGPAKGFES